MSGRLAVVAISVLSVLSVLSGPVADAAVRRVEIKGVGAVKFLYGRREYAQARLAAYSLLWKDIHQPEVLYTLARSVEELRDAEQAAVFNQLLLRVIEEAPEGEADPRSASRRATCRKALERLDGKHRAESDRYLQTAASKTFASPERVEDLWMTQVECDLRGLHALYAWKLVGGRKDMRPDWIHNTQGIMHRSGAKSMADVHGRRGVLFCLPAKKSKRPARAVWRGPVKGGVLRIGTRAYGFPYVLNVLAGGKQIFSQRIGKDAWQDLRIPLPPGLAEDTAFVLELVVPENQRWHEGLFFDYIDFFDN